MERRRKINDCISVGMAQQIDLMIKIAEQENLEKGQYHDVNIKGQYHEVNKRDCNKR